MTHYLTLKMKAGHMSDELFSLTKNTFFQLKKELGCILTVNVYLNCVSRKSNADLLVELELTEPAALDIYLNHPLHLAFVYKIEPHLSHRATFDRA